MRTTPPSPAPHSPPLDTANDRFKRSTARHYWIALIVAVASHFATFVFFPGMTIAGAERPDELLEVIDPLEKINLPQPPEPIQRPPMPVVSDIDDTSVTIPENVSFDDFSPADMTRPPARDESIDEEIPRFIPLTLRPRLLNGDDVAARAGREYPSILRGAGIGGTPVVWILLDEQGNPVKSQIHETSGFAALDSAALRVTTMMRFSPGENRGRAVRVWVQIPINFRER